MCNGIAKNIVYAKYNAEQSWLRGCTVCLLLLHIYADVSDKRPFVHFLHGVLINSLRCFLYFTSHVVTCKVVKKIQD